MALPNWRLADEYLWPKIPHIVHLLITSSNNTPPPQKKKWVFSRPALPINLWEKQAVSEGIIGKGSWSPFRLSFFPLSYFLKYNRARTQRCILVIQFWIFFSYCILLLDFSSISKKHVAVGAVSRDMKSIVLIVCV